MFATSFSQKTFLIKSKDKLFLEKIYLLEIEKLISGKDAENVRSANAFCY